MKMLATKDRKNFQFSATIILMLLVTLSTASTATEDEVYLLATALYCTDLKGRILLITRPLPSSVENIIITDLQARVHPNAMVKVQTAHNNITSLPFEESIQMRNPDVLKARLPKTELRKMLHNFWFMVNSRPRDAKATTKPRHSGPDDYVPNDIYYAVEKKCANWADGCNAKSPSILEMSSKNFKVRPLQYGIPKKSRWVP